MVAPQIRCHVRPAPQRDGDGAGQRGATLAEYALALGLVVVALASGARVLEGAARDDLESRAQTAGAPDLQASGPASSTTTVSTTTAPMAPPATTSGQTTVTATATGRGAKDGSDWVATVTVVVRDQATGEAMSGLSVTAQWSAGVTGETSCVTGTSGSCAMSTSEINRRGSGSVSSVTLTVLDVTGPNATLAPPAPQVVVAAP